jgi:murein L,D-transpeptidase YafK
MNTHKLKTWKTFYRAIIKGDKTFEVRRNDRNFKVGDNLQLIEVDNENNMTPTKHECLVKVKYLLSGEEWGIVKGHVVLGIEIVEVIW